MTEGNKGEILLTCDLRLLTFDLRPSTFDFIRFAHEVAPARHSQTSLSLLSLNRNFRLYR